METKKKIPIGIEDFKEIIDKNCYFVDKSLLIRDLLESGSKVSLFTRPRRFGKTLNMSMIRYFFEQSEEDHSSLFQDLNIAKTGEKYLEYQGQYPVISITLKDVEQSDYQSSLTVFKNLIASEVWRHNQLLTSGKVMPMYRTKLQAICDGAADEATVIVGIKTLSDALYQYYGKKVIILIDEYDVPLQNAYFKGYYDQMVELIRSVFSSAVKTNSSLEFAVLTGCLRISKESIFTGLNNPDVYSIIETEYSSAFGFTETEVREMAEYYGQAEHFEEIREWYDGYLFGRTEIYNPWSVLKYIQQSVADAYIKASPYWSNTSSNSIIHDLIEKSESPTREAVKKLIDGGTVQAKLYNDITYANMNVNEEHIWSFLLYTGYLKPVRLWKENKAAYFEGKLPNVEVESIYEDVFWQWFERQIKEADKSKFFHAVLSGDAKTIERELNSWMDRSISYHDGYENYYHGFLVGLLQYSEQYLIESNRESGTGRSDIVIKDTLDHDIAVVIETKAADTKDALEKECQKALKQIEEKQYANGLRNEGYPKVLKYGIAFYQKHCKVMLG